MNSVYGDISEEVPKDAPAPLGKTVMTMTYVDANLYHDWTTGRAVTGTLHFLNGTTIDWFSKRQNTVETATYGSEFVAEESPPIKLLISDLLSDTLVSPCWINHTCSMTTTIWSPVPRYHTLS